VRPAGTLAATVLGRAAAPTRRVEADAQRRVPVARARRAIREGRLELGAFVLAANAIDARARDRPVDEATARDLYERRVAALRDELAERDLGAAVPRVFADLRYFGRPGGLMADALVEGGGSCEPLAHLVVAAAYDA